MAKFDLIAVGRLKRATPFYYLFEFYNKQMKWSLAVSEIPTGSNDKENKAILEKIKDGAHVFVLDERGKTLPSPDFANTIQALQNQGMPHIQFIIGGAEGLSEPIRQRADTLLSFGAQTWPHMMVRVMLMEQLYRSQQILNGHPYHKV